ncbi:MAG: methyltransferase domain-containing protein [Methylobacter sp.]|nr:methyltransferase domain-containing protein [Methylobacter sp.]
MSIAKREAELAVYLDKQPYRTELDGVTLEIAKNVFPSDFGLTSSFFGNFILQQQPAATALDMACGSGYFAFLLKKIGCTDVLGVDFNEDAIKCATKNSQLNPSLQPSDFIHSDLFVKVPPSKFDLIVFNFNYYPSNGDFGLNSDGGQSILKRFFSQVESYINENTIIYIPYSEFVGEEHDPKHICLNFGFSAEIMVKTQNETGEHYVYKITKSSSLS